MEFDAHNAVLLTLSAGVPRQPRTLHVRSLRDYSLRMAYCGDPDVEDVKCAPAMLWMFRSREGRRIPAILVDATSFQPVACIRVDVGTTGPISFVEATSRNLIVKAPNGPLVITKVRREDGAGGRGVVRRLMPARACARQTARVARLRPTGESPIASRTRSRTRGLRRATGVGASAGAKADSGADSEAEEPTTGVGDPVFKVVGGGGSVSRYWLADVLVYRAGAPTQRRAPTFYGPRLFNFLFSCRALLACFDDRIELWGEGGTLLQR